MSDRIEALSKEYDKNVPAEQSRSVGLFTIPEYPELESERGMWATVLEVLLTTLRYLAPATLLTLFWGHQRFFFNLLKYIDSAFRTLIFSHEDQKQEVIRWLSEVGPVRVEDLDTIWRQGWIVCGVLDAALPGACAGHAPTTLSLKHAQAIADHYLGVEPMFSRQELEANDVLSKHEEWKLIKFLEGIRNAIAKLAPPPTTPKQITERPSPNSTQFTLDYIARGSGLTAAQINNKMYFKIYPTAQQSLDPGEIIIEIRGPKNIYGMSTVPPILGKAQMIRQTLLGLQSKQNNYTDSILPVTQGATYLRNYGKHDMNKTYYIPKTQYDIEIDIERNSDHAKIGYTVPKEGKYEISITSCGENIVGSPFIVTASKNILDILERDSFCLEDGEEIDIVDVKNDRKVVLRIVDFVTEKMLLNENGSLEKLTDDEAKNLMEFDSLGQATRSDVEAINVTNNEELTDKSTDNSKKFYNVASRILKMNKVCQALNNMEKHSMKITTDSEMLCIQNDVPDIVNSTLNENQTTTVNNQRERIIIPENISVSLLMDRAIDNIPNTESENFQLQDLESYKILRDPFEDDNISIDTIQSTNNPFLRDLYDTAYTEKEFRSFITSEYETNNSQHEESHTFSNPFINLKQSSKDTIIPETMDKYTEHVDDNSSIISNVSQTADSERIEIIEKEYTNPFFVLNTPEPDDDITPVTDFIIGAPVSLPPIVSSLNDIMSLNNCSDNKTFRDNFHFRKENENASFLSSQESFEQREEIPSISPFHSLGSDTYNFLSQSNLQRSRDISPRELWDSAYVSIDDNASTPDNNNNSSDRSVSETVIKNNLATNKELNINLGIERETWDSSAEVRENSIHEDIRNFRWEFKRPVFTPIIEETEKSLTSGLKENVLETETDTVSQAFAELNEIYDEIFPKPEESISSEDKESTLQNFEVEYIIEDNNIRVDSASENSSDVKRHAGEIEGSISEVQANETESVSASRDLRVKNESSHKDATQFGDTVYSNIVLEKKRYWDEKIRLIEAKNLEESKLQQRRKRISAKHFRHNDSLSKRKGKQIVKNFLNSGNNSKTSFQSFAPTDETTHVNTVQVQLTENLRSDIKLVEKWKNYWDTKLEVESMDKNSTSVSDSHTNDIFIQENLTPCPSTTEYEITNGNVTPDLNITDINTDSQMSPVKHELSEEVFKAFETCPKRFFGTSRRHILNKIDSFLGKPTVENIPKPDHIISLSHESGLVSSRISLFHNISQTEDIPPPRIKQKQNNNNIFDMKSNNKISSELQKDALYLNSCHNIESREEPQLEQTVSDEIVSEIVSTSVSKPNCNQAAEKELNFTDDGIEPKEDCSNKNNDQNDQNYVNESTLVEDTISPIINETCANKDTAVTNEQGQRRVKCRRLKSFSKSEMDIFNKISSSDLSDDFEKHKSVEELPKINVKNFISLYEDASKATQSQSTKPDMKRKSNYNSSSSPGTPLKSHHIPSASKHYIRHNMNTSEENSKKPTIQNTNLTENHTRSSSVLSERGSNSEIDKKYLSLSDIELEIIEQKDEKKQLCVSQKVEETTQVDYKSRFKIAKEYFQSLEELRDVRKDRKLSECKIKLNDQSTESLAENEEKPKEFVKTRKIKSKSLSMPSSEISKIWNELQGKTKQEETETKKLVKISEKFNVEDLFEDVMEGRLSRQGSLRGIPHKKAVLETFKSMENISDNKLSSYDMAVQSNDFSQQNLAKNAQTYLSEYPYLPTTDPSKFQSRFDASASGLISYNELLKSKRRRNSVPDIRLNPTVTENVNV